MSGITTGACVTFHSESRLSSVAPVKRETTSRRNSTDECCSICAGGRHHAPVPTHARRSEQTWFRFGSVHAFGHADAPLNNADSNYEIVSSFIYHILSSSLFAPLSRWLTDAHTAMACYRNSFAKLSSDLVSVHRMRILLISDRLSLASSDP